MSLAEVMPPYRDEAPSGMGRAGDRTPPQDMVAEQCVLGAMMMSKDAIADVVEVLRGADFYRPAHEQIYDAIIDLYGRGEPADAVTVSAELGKRGELMRVGGGPYLHDLLQSVPVAANAGFYAEIVREKAILRRLVDASIRIGQMSYAAEGDVDRHRRPGPGRGVRGHRPAGQRGLQVAVGADAADAGRDGGHRVPRRRPVRGADRLRRAGRADQRPASGADGHRGRRDLGAESRRWLWTSPGRPRSRTT